MALGSAYLMDFTRRERTPGVGATPPAYPLNISDGPEDTWSHLELVFNKPTMAYAKAGGGNLACRTIVAEHHGVEPKDVVLVSGGTSLVNHYAINSTLHDGGLVVTEFPVYDPLEAASRVSHASNAKEIGTSSAYQIPRSAPDFQIGEEAWRAALRTHKPRLIVVSNPHNPTGIAIHNLPALLAILDEWNAALPEAEQTFVLVDEVYKEVYVRAPIPCAAVLSSFAISTFSLTKAFGLSGVRMGILLSRNAAVVERVLRYHTAAMCANPGLLEDLWLQIYQQRFKVLALIRDRQQRMFSLVKKLFDEAGVVYYTPDGGTVVVVRLPDSCSDAQAFVQELRAAHDVQVTAGSFFRMEGHVRLAYMNLAEDVVMEGVRRFAAFYAGKLKAAAATAGVGALAV